MKSEQKQIRAHVLTSRCELTHWPTFVQNVNSIYRWSLAMLSDQYLGDDTHNGPVSHYIVKHHEKFLLHTVLTWKKTLHQLNRKPYVNTYEHNPVYLFLHSFRSSCIRQEFLSEMCDSGNQGWRITSADRGSHTCTAGREPAANWPAKQEVTSPTDHAPLCDGQNL